MRDPKKRMPLCNGADSGNAVMRKHADFGMVFNHNNECGVKQKMSKGDQRNVSQKSDVRVDSELDWNQINWQQVQDTVTRLQARIVKAQQEGRIGKVKSLTYSDTLLRGKSLSCEEGVIEQGKSHSRSGRNCMEYKRKQSPSDP